MSTSTIHDSGYVVGCDLGQANDYTALAIVQVTTETLRADELDVRRAFERRRAEGWHSVPHFKGIMFAGGGGIPYIGDVLTTENTYAVGYLERMPLGTSYPDIVDHVKGLMREPKLAKSDTRLAVDATGVGRPIIDAMRRAGLKPTPVTITAGEHATRALDGYRRVPKRDLVGALAVLLQTKRLKIARELKHAERLVEELQDFRVKFSAAGNDTYGAWRETLHDDLVLALAVAVWLGEQKKGAGQPWMFLKA